MSKLLIFFLLGGGTSFYGNRSKTEFPSHVPHTIPYRIFVTFHRRHVASCGSLLDGQVNRRGADSPIGRVGRNVVSTGFGARAVATLRRESRPIGGGELSAVRRQVDVLRHGHERPPAPSHQHVDGTKTDRRHGQVQCVHDDGFVGTSRIVCRLEVVSHWSHRYDNAW